MPRRDGHGVDQPGGIPCLEPHLADGRAKVLIVYLRMVRELIISVDEFDFDSGMRSGRHERNEQRNESHKQLS
jgi:hypothetical protein